VGCPGQNNDGVMMCKPLKVVDRRMDIAGFYLKKGAHIMQEW